MCAPQHTHEARLFESRPLFPAHGPLPRCLPEEQGSERLGVAPRLQPSDRPCRDTSSQKPQIPGRMLYFHVPFAPKLLSKSVGGKGHCEGWGTRSPLLPAGTQAPRTASAPLPCHGPAEHTWATWVGDRVAGPHSYPCSGARAHRASVKAPGLLSFLSTVPEAPHGSPGLATQPWPHPHSLGGQLGLSK